MNDLKLIDGTLPSRVFVGFPSSSGYYQLQLRESEYQGVPFPTAVGSIVDGLLANLREVPRTGDLLDLTRSERTLSELAAVRSRTSFPVFAATYEGVSAALLSGSRLMTGGASASLVPQGCEPVQPMLPDVAIENFGAVWDQAGPEDADVAQPLAPMSEAP